MRTLIIDGSYFIRKAYTAYAKVKGDRPPGPGHLLHACINRIFSVTRPGNLGPHQVVMVLRSVSEDMPAHFQAQQLALPPQLGAFGIKVVQLPGKANVLEISRLANSPEFQAAGVTIGSDHVDFLGYLTPSTWVLRNDKVKALRRDTLANLLKLPEAPLDQELPAFVVLQGMPRMGAISAAKLLGQWRPLNLFTGFGQSPADIAHRFHASSPTDGKRFDSAWWGAFAAHWDTIFPSGASEHLADYTLPRPSREAVIRELDYYGFKQLAHYTTTTDWADGIVGEGSAVAAVSV